MTRICKKVGKLQKMSPFRNLTFPENFYVLDQNKNKTCKMIRTWQKMLKVAACAKLKKISKINLSPKIQPARNMVRMWQKTFKLTKVEDEVLKALKIQYYINELNFFSFIFNKFVEQKSKGTNEKEKWMIISFNS